MTDEPATCAGCGEYLKDCLCCEERTFLRNEMKWVEAQLELEGSTTATLGPKGTLQVPALSYGITIPDRIALGKYKHDLMKILETL